MPSIRCRIDAPEALLGFPVVELSIVPIADRPPEWTPTLTKTNGAVRYVANHVTYDPPDCLHDRGVATSLMPAPSPVCAAHPEGRASSPVQRRGGLARALLPLRHPAREERTAASRDNRSMCFEPTPSARRALGSRNVPKGVT